MVTKELKVAFIHGRPSGHPIHALYAKQLNAEFIFEDFLIRWHDKPNSLKIKRYLSWIFCAIFFPSKRKYQVYLTECIRIPQLVMKLLGLINGNQKLIALMADESLYFNLIGRYPSLTSSLMKLFLKKADAIICIGEFQTNVAKRILKKDEHNKIYTIFNGVMSDRQNKLRLINPNLDSQNILFIGNASVEWRIWYKGIDIMIEAFSKALKINDNLKFYIVGEIDKQFITQLLNPYDSSVRTAVVFAGRSNQIEDFIEKCGLYLHCSRGDAFPTTILESLTAGLVPLISDCTGTIEIIKNVDEGLIVPLSSEVIAERINWYFKLSRQNKERLSLRCRQVMRDFTEEKAVNHFKHTFQKVMSDLNCSADLRL